MKKLIVMAVIAILAISFAFAQDDAVKMDAGLRGGIRSGITARYFMSEDNCIEALFTTYSWSGIILTGLYEFQKPLDVFEGAEGISWFYGGGVHVGHYKLGSYYYRNDLALGLNGIVGVEYDLEQHFDYPLSVSLDWKPAFDILGGWAGNLADVALSLRYRF